MRKGEKQPRRIAVVLPWAIYQQLDDISLREDRDPFMQARRLLVEAIQREHGGRDVARQVSGSW